MPPWAYKIKLCIAAIIDDGYNIVISNNIIQNVPWGKLLAGPILFFIIHFSRHKHDFELSHR